MEQRTFFLPSNNQKVFVSYRVAFLISLASVAKTQSFGRAGLMCLVKCISSAACGDQKHSISENDQENGVSAGVTEGRLAQESSIDKANLLDVLRFVIESSRQHFNPTYRHQGFTLVFSLCLCYAILVVIILSLLAVCEEILDAAVSVMAPYDVPLETLLLFVASLPRELTDSGGIRNFFVTSSILHFRYLCHISIGNSLPFY